MIARGKQCSRVKKISPGSRHKWWACLICNKKTLKAYLSNIISIACSLRGVQDTPARFQSFLSTEKLCAPLLQLSAGTNSNLLVGWPKGISATDKLSLSRTLPLGIWQGTCPLLSRYHWTCVSALPSRLVWQILTSHVSLSSMLKRSVELTFVANLCATMLSRVPLSALCRST